MDLIIHLFTVGRANQSNGIEIPVLTFVLQALMDQILNQVDKIIKEKKVSSGIRFMLQDLKDLREVRWILLHFINRVLSCFDLASTSSGI